MELIDIGANLSHDSFRHDLPVVLERARSAGVVQMVVTGASETESRAAHDIAVEYPNVLFATAGVHPHLAREWTRGTAAILEELADSPAVVALGETGLDFNRDFSPRPIQERVFSEQLALAARLEMPVFVHERDAHQRLVAILKEHRAQLGPAVIHCFTGTEEELDHYLEMDLHVGITGWICDERRGLHLRELVSRIPLERLMLETDAPYLLPRDLKPRPKTRRNEPMYLAHILRTVADCYRLNAEEVARATTETARAFFKLGSMPADAPS